MGTIEKIKFGNKKISLETMDVDSYKEISKAPKNSITDYFGVYFILSTSDNNLPFKEIIKSSEFDKLYIGKIGVVQDTVKDEKTGNTIFTGAELSDLSIMPQYRRSGYASLLAKKGLEWLTKQDIHEAYFGSNTMKSATPNLFRKLENEGRLKVNKIYEEKNEVGSLITYYSITDF